jgi:hypothetical protein
MAWKLTGDKHANRFHTAIQRLVPLGWGNLDSFTCLKNKVVILDLQGQFTFQNEEELACMDVGVPDLNCSSGHEFLDDAEVWRFNEVPTIGISSGCPPHLERFFGLKVRGGLPVAGYPHWTKTLYKAKHAKQGTAINRLIRKFRRGARAAR